MRTLTTILLFISVSAILVTPALADESGAKPALAPSQRVIAELGQVPGLVPAPSSGPAAAAQSNAGAGAHASITLQGSGGSESRVRSNLAVTPDALPGIDAAVVSGTDSQSYVVVLRDAKAATDVNFNVSGFGGKLTIDKLGGVVVSNADGSWDGRISAPWAYDAKGRALPTSFTVNGNTITQHIDTRGAAFPVVADPHYTWGWVTGTVYFNRHETHIIATNARWVDLVVPFAPPPWDALLAAYAAYISTVASHAHTLGMCVKFKSTGVAGIYGGRDGDGYCR